MIYGKEYTFAFLTFNNNFLCFHCTENDFINILNFMDSFHYNVYILLFTCLTQLVVVAKAYS